MNVEDEKVMKSWNMRESIRSVVLLVGPRMITNKVVCATEPKAVTMLAQATLVASSIVL
jgi:membrane protein YdbS with pleckstrin-like domain